MTRKSFHDLVLESNSVQWNRNWEADSQPGGFSNYQIYADIARKLRIPALQQIKTLLEHVPNGILKDDMGEKARYYSLTPREYHGIKTISMDDLIEELRANDEVLAKKASFKRRMDVAFQRSDSAAVVNLVQESKTPEAKKYLEATPDQRFLKSEERIKEKLPEYEVGTVVHPERIGDYLRTQVLFDNAEDLAKARHVMQFGEVLSITSQKDKLRRPDEKGGHRSFMCHAEVSDENYSLRYEAMLSLFQAETFMLDKSYRHSERVSLEMGRKVAATQPGLSTTYFAAAQTLEQLRKLSFYGLYAGVEKMNDLLDPDIDIDGICKDATAVAQFNAVSSAYILGKLPSVAARFPQFVSDRHLQ